MFKTYVGLSRDHSGSMRSIARYAARDYNAKVADFKENAIGQTIKVSVVECGYGATSSVRRVEEHVDVSQLKPINESSYSANGRGTPLWDSVGELIELFTRVPDYNDPTVSFMVMVITDGEENASQKYDEVMLAAKIRELQATDRWTFVFRVPRGAKKHLCNRLGISEFNVEEWDQTSQGVELATRRDSTAFKTYFTSRASGMTSTNKFYADLNEQSFEAAKVDLKDISDDVMYWSVCYADEIRPFVNDNLRGGSMLKGAAFYQLTKTEKVQGYKSIIIREKKSGVMYGGQAARQVLGLPSVECKLAPGSHPSYDIFIQSTSVNRKLEPNTHLVYWAAAGTAYKS